MPAAPAAMASHRRNQSASSVNAPALLDVPAPAPYRTELKHAPSKSSTFAPSFIKTEKLQRGAVEANGIEGEVDFSGKRYVWLKDPDAAFVRGWVVEEVADNKLVVQCDDGSVGLSGLHSLATLTTITAARG